MKIAKEEFDALYSDDITKKQYDAIIDKIDKRFFEIITTLRPGIKSYLNNEWFDYGNCSYDFEESGGHFDTNAFKNDIELGGEWSALPEPFNESIPTRWLWEDFQEDFNAQVKACKEAEALQKAKAAATAKTKKDAKLQIIETIKSKLTPEELKLVKFKA